MPNRDQNEISLKELAKASGIAYHKLMYDVRRGKLPVIWRGKRVFVSLDNPAVQSVLTNTSEYVKTRVKLKPRPVEHEGVRYPSVLSLARAKNRSQMTVMQWIWRGKARYVEEE